jgi:hypothetical protein
MQAGSLAPVLWVLLLAQELEKNSTLQLRRVMPGA